MGKNLINNKSVARLASIQTIYQLQDGDTENILEELLLKIRDFYQDAEIFEAALLKDYGKFKPSYKYLDQLTRYTYQNLAMIDQIISSYLTNGWQITKLPKLLHSILRVAIAELKYLPNVPTKVVIDEYTNITANLLNDSETGFVNSLLDKFSADNLG